MKCNGHKSDKQNGNLEVWEFQDLLNKSIEVGMWQSRIEGNDCNDKFISFSPCFNFYSSPRVIYELYFLK